MTTERNPATNAPGPVYICHGATGQQCQVLKVFPEPDSLWVGNGVSFHDIVGGDGSSIVVNPAAGEYQKFESTGVSFELDCAADGKDGELQFRLRSEYSANAFPIELRLGDYLRKLSTRLAPPEFVSRGDEVKIQVAVESFYIAGKMLGGVAVEWWMGDLLLATLPTDDSGVGTFIFTADTLGDNQILAKILNQYDDSVLSLEHNFKIVTDEPWKGVRWFINGEVVVPPIKIERGKANLLKVVAPELKGAVVKLAAIDADRLKFVAVPRFDEDVVLDGNGAAQWTLTQSQSISAVLRLTVETIQSPVKLQDSFFVMSKNLADEVGFLLEGVIIPPEGAEFMGGESKSLKLSYFNAEVLESMPLAIEVEIESGLTPGDIESVPAAGELVSKHDWLVSAAEKNGTFKIKLHSFDWVTPLYTPLLRLKTVETVFIFMDKGLNPLPVPPEEFLLPASVPIQNIVAILKNTDGVPFRDVPGVFHHPGMQDFPFKTNADGRVNLWVQNQENSSGHTFKVSAVVELETESRVADLLVRIV